MHPSGRWLFTSLYGDGAVAVHPVATDGTVGAATTTRRHVPAEGQGAAKAHQVVFDVVLDLYGRGEPADAITVAAELNRTDQLSKMGGAVYLHTLIASTPTAANAGYYAAIVAEQAVLRRLVEAGTRVVQLNRRTRTTLDEAGVVAKYGVAPASIPDYLALVGDAAHGVHPIAGQGVNLGYRDAAALAQVLVEGARMGLDLGDRQLLDRYQRWRGTDTFMVALATDTLTRIYGVKGRTASRVRRFGMGLIDRVGPVKDRLMAEARGTSGDLPLLLRGMPI